MSNSKWKYISPCRVLSGTLTSLVVDSWKPRIQCEPSAAVRASLPPLEPALTSSPPPVSEEKIQIPKATAHTDDLSLSKVVSNDPTSWSLFRERAHNAEFPGTPWAFTHGFLGKGQQLQSNFYRAGARAPGQGHGVQPGTSTASLTAGDHLPQGWAPLHFAPLKVQLT